MSTSPGPLGTRLFVGLQHLLPQHLLSRIVLRATRVRTRWFKDALIGGFLRLYDVDLAEALESDARRYESFNAFFTRALRPGVRDWPNAGDMARMPVDGTVSECGALQDGELLQAKGIRYDARSLLGGDAALAGEFDAGHFATLYLAPYNYHRIHMPVRGTLRRALHVPGDLFSVNASTAASVPGLFARNERVVCIFDTELGPLALVLVGALFVGSISLTWAGEVTTVRPLQVRELPLPAAPLVVEAGAELGRFNMGSTVIALFGSGGIELLCPAPGSAVRLGQPLAQRRA